MELAPHYPLGHADIFVGSGSSLESSIRGLPEELGLPEEGGSCLCFSPDRSRGSFPGSPRSGGTCRTQRGSRPCFPCPQGGSCLLPLSSSLPALLPRLARAFAWGTPSPVRAAAGVSCGCLSLVLTPGQLWLLFWLPPHLLSTRQPEGTFRGDLLSQTLPWIRP